MKVRIFFVAFVLAITYSKSWCEEISGRLVYLQFVGMPRKHLPALIWMDKSFSPNWKLTEVFRDSFDVLTFNNAPKFSISIDDISALLCLLNGFHLSNDGQYQILIFDNGGLLNTIRLNQDEIQTIANFAEQNGIKGYQILMRWTGKIEEDS